MRRRFYGNYRGLDAAWSSRHSAESEQALALYLFREHGGKMIHSAVPSGIDLDDSEAVLGRRSVIFSSPLYQNFIRTRELPEECSDQRCRIRSSWLYG